MLNFSMIKFYLLITSAYIYLIFPVDFDKKRMFFFK